MFANASRLADLIEEGMASHPGTVRENHRAYLGPNDDGYGGPCWGACALGFALVAKVGDPEKASHLFQGLIRGDGGPVDTCAEILGMEELPLLNLVDTRHRAGMSARAIVALLRRMAAGEDDPAMLEEAALAAA